MEVAHERLACPMDFVSMSEYRAFLEDTSSSLPELLEGHPPERGEELWEALAAKLRPHADREGRLHLPGEAILVSGRRPGSP